MAAAVVLGSSSAAALLLASRRWRPLPARLRRLRPSPVSGQQPTATMRGRRSGLPDAASGRAARLSDGGADAPSSERASKRFDGRAVLVVIAAASLALVWPPALVVGIALVAVRPRLARRRRARRHLRAVADGLPDAIDLLALAVSAGQTPPLAARTMAAHGAPPFDGAFAEVVRRVDLGQRFADALDELGTRLGPACEPLRAALVASDRYGVALGPTLDQLAADARRERRRLAETAARKLPVRLSFPLVGCILPAFALLTLVPLLAGAVGSLRL